MLHARVQDTLCCLGERPVRLSSEEVPRAKELELELELALALVLVLVLESESESESV
ncbi:MAG TPA: hypothetical protein VFS47_15000 [Steroidobacteraceae bacterium]|nr:hypothetical protein [Steroidobacteraceae bacterium]